MSSSDKKSEKPKKSSKSSSSSSSSSQPLSAAAPPTSPSECVLLRIPGGLTCLSPSEPIAFQVFSPSPSAKHAISIDSVSADVPTNGRIILGGNIDEKVLQSSSQFPFQRSSVVLAGANFATADTSSMLSKRRLDHDEVDLYPSHPTSGPFPLSFMRPSTSYGQFSVALVKRRKTKDSEPSPISSMKFLPVTSNQIFLLQPNVSDIQASTRAALLNATEPSTVSGLSFIHQQRDLASNFGSRKTQSALTSRINNRVTISNDNQNDTEDASVDGSQNQQARTLRAAVESIGQLPFQPVGTNGEVTASAADDLPIADNHALFLPPYNLQATQAFEIYPVDRLLSSRAFKSLDKQAAPWRELLSKGPKALKDLHLQGGVELYSNSKLVQHKMEQLSQQVNNAEELTDADESALLQIIKLVYYFHLLLQYRSGARNKRKLLASWAETVCGDPMKRELLQTFTTVNGRDPKELGLSASPDAQDSVKYDFDRKSEKRLLCYICVASLTIFTFSLDSTCIGHILSDLSMTYNDLVKYFQDAGCEASKSKITLKAPLKFPNLRRGRG